MMSGTSPLLRDLKPSIHCERCWKKSGECDGKYASFDRHGSLGSTKILYLAQDFSLVSSKSESLVVSGESFLLDSSRDSRLPGFLFEAAKYHWPVRLNDCDDFVINSLMGAGLKDLIVNHSRQKIHNVIDDANKASGTSKIASFLQFGSGDDVLKQYRPSSFDAAQINLTDLSYLPRYSCKNELAISKEWPDLNTIPQKPLISCSDTESTCSTWPSSSSLHCSFSKALLRCVWKGGIPHFIFMMDNKEHGILVANPRRVGPSGGDFLSFLYLFHSYRGSGKISANEGKNVCKTIGKMKVSSSFVLGANKSILMEKEFVLFGTKNDSSSDMQSSTSTKSGNGFMKKAAKMLTSGHSLMCYSSEKIGETRYQPDGSLDEAFLHSLCDFIPDSVNRLECDFYPNDELAAIIIKDHVSVASEATTVGGWGIKFLPDTLQDTSLDKNRRETHTCVDVVVPTGFHGGPNAKSGGPSSLTERFRSGGRCDCGGWDMGCPLRVLRSSGAPFSSPPPSVEDPEDGQTLHLVAEGGGRYAEPLLKMARIGGDNGDDESSYYVYFHPSLSVLQSMSIGVAVIHSRPATDGTEGSAMADDAPVPIRRGTTS